MRIVDLAFYDKYLARNLYLLKFDKLNFDKKNYFIPSFNCLNLIFFIQNITNFEALCTSNYFYLINYFFGCNGSVYHYQTQFHLGLWYYSFQIKATLKKNNRYFILYFLINDICPQIGKDYYISYNKNQLSFTMYDLNMFVDWNSSVGLFNLEHNLDFNFIFNGGNFYNGLQLLSIFKFNKI